MLLGEFVSFHFYVSSFEENKFNNSKKKKKSKNKADDGFGTVCKVDAGYYSQGFCFFFFFSKSF